MIYLLSVILLFVSGPLGEDSFIQVIDCSFIRGKFGDVTEENYGKVANDLGKAMSGIGFAYLINHGLDLDKIAKVHKVSSEFFTLPMAIKKNYGKPDPSKSFHGYAPPGDELHDANTNTTECREAFDIWGKDALNPEKYPHEIDGFKSAFDDTRQDLNNMGKKLLKCFGKYLKLEDESYFVKKHKHLDDPKVPNQTQFRVLFYYPLNGMETYLSGNAIRLGEHSDWGSITLLFQDSVGGLEIKTRTGEWIQATPIKDSIILNNGNLMELWTNGIMHAALHRVKIPTPLEHLAKPRQSFVHFIIPDEKEEIHPIVNSPLSEGQLLERSPVIAGEYIREKLKALLNY